MIEEGVSGPKVGQDFRVLGLIQIRSWHLAKEVDPGHLSISGQTIDPHPHAGVGGIVDVLR
jgi:hypothetical protein